MRDNYYRTGEGFLCVYSITIEDSYRLLTNFHEQILRVTENDGVRGHVLSLSLARWGRDRSSVACAVCGVRCAVCFRVVRVRWFVATQTQIPFVVAGNKADLEDKRQVTKQQGQELAQKFNAPFLEVPLSCFPLFGHCWAHRRVRHVALADNPLPRFRRRRRRTPT
jgi:GTPase SAR1 family protein